MRNYVEIIAVPSISYSYMLNLASVVALRVPCFSFASNFSFFRINGKSFSF
uniref:Uncharacterized protein n=1 Tax=Arundo donax TaxID=35708 RepID=A0A0A9ASJ2_ARUDO